MQERYAVLFRLCHRPPTSETKDHAQAAHLADERAVKLAGHTNPKGKHSHQVVLLEAPCLDQTVSAPETLRPSGGAGMCSIQTAHGALSSNGRCFEWTTLSCLGLTNWSSVQASQFVALLSKPLCKSAQGVAGSASLPKLS